MHCLLLVLVWMDTYFGVICFPVLGPGFKLLSIYLEDFVCEQELAA